MRKAMTNYAVAPGEYLATRAEFPSLSRLAPTEAEALEGIRALVADSEAEMSPAPYTTSSAAGQDSGMSEDDWLADLRASARRDAPRFHVQDDGRARLQVLAVCDGVAYAVTPWHTTVEPMKLSVAEIAADCDLPASEVTGREYTATGDADGLSGFRLVRDPRV